MENTSSDPSSKRQSYHTQPFPLSKDGLDTSTADTGSTEEGKILSFVAFRQAAGDCMNYLLLITINF